MKDTSNLAIYNGHKNHVIKIMEKVFFTRKSRTNSDRRSGIPLYLSSCLSEVKPNRQKQKYLLIAFIHFMVSTYYM